jgi:hypothetical protein
MNAASEMLKVLKVSRGNVASLGPAGSGAVWATYQVWLAELDRVIELAEAAGVRG